TSTWTRSPPVMTGSSGWYTGPRRTLRSASGRTRGSTSTHAREPAHDAPIPAAVGLQRRPAGRLHDASAAARVRPGLARARRLGRLGGRGARSIRDPARPARAPDAALLRARVAERRAARPSHAA